MGEVIARFTSKHSDEVRVVSIRSERGMLFVREETTGELTAQIYGERNHVQLISLSEYAATLAGFANNVAALSKFFSTEDVYLTDLMDALDAWGVPYRYLSAGQLSGVVMRGA